jgi:ankyrin repeat protein
VSAPCRNTALHGASSNGHTESVKALLEKGADVNAENHFNRGFLLPVSEGPWLEILSAPCRHTALHLASRNGHTESVKALLEKGAAVNAENKDRCAVLPVLHGWWPCAPAKAVRCFARC